MNIKKKLYLLVINILFTVILTISNNVIADTEKKQYKFKVYFSAKLSKPEYQAINTKISNSIFNDKYDVFLPQDFVIPKLDHSFVEKCAYYVDKEAIDWADIVFLRSPYGKDCSWEIGYAKGKNKFIVGFFQDKESINDSMVTSSLDVIITDNKDIMTALKSDKRTKDKCFFTAKLEDCFDKVIANFYSKK
jgi:nucleoside 2-deoxyribosyltransferase